MNGPQIVPGFAGGGLRAPTQPVPQAPDGKPVPVPPPGVKQQLAHPQDPVPQPVQAAGFLGSVGDFNAKVYAAHNAYVQRNGVAPSPRLVFDVVRSPVQPEDYPKLFALPPNPVTAQHALVASQPGLKLEPNRDELIQQMNEAIRNGTFDSWIAEHHDEIAKLPNLGTAVLSPLTPTASLSTPRSRAASAAGEQAFSSLPQSAQMQVSAQTGEQGIKQLEPGTIQQAGFASTAHMGWLTDYVGPWASQIGMGLVLGLPTLAYKLGKADYELARGRPGEALGEVKNLGSQIKQGFSADIHDPLHNAGNLFLDAFGLASFGAGTAARIGAAARAAGEGASAAEVASSLLFKPPPGTYEISKGGLSATGLRFDNAFARTMQRGVIAIRQAGLDVRHAAAAGLDAPAGASALVARAVYDIGDLLFHPLERVGLGGEAKLRKTIQAQQRVERATQDTIQGAMVNAGHASIRLTTLGPRIDKALSPAESMALYIMHSDIPGTFTDQAAAWRAAQENMIQLGVGDPQAHASVLTLVNQAEKLIKSGEIRPKLQRAIEDMAHVEENMAVLKGQWQGLTPEMAEGRVAKFGLMLEAAGKAKTKEELQQAFSDIASGNRPVTASAEITDEMISRRQQDAAEYVKKVDARGGPKDYSELASYEFAKKIATDQQQAKFALSDHLRREEAKRQGQPLQRRNPNSRYFPVLGQERAGSPQGGYWAGQGPFGVPRPMIDPTMTHRFEGHYLQAGPLTMDLSRVMGEAYGRAARKASKLGMWLDLYKSSVARKPKFDEEHYIPIRDERQIDPKLRRAIVAQKEQGRVQLTPEDVEGLTDSEAHDLHNFLFPDPGKLGPEDHVRWIDQRLLWDKPNTYRAGKLAKAFTTVNEPLRDATLFLRPSYAMNMLNSGSMLLMEMLGDPASLFTVFRDDAGSLSRHTSDWLSALSGESRSLSYAPDMGKATKLSHTLAQGWNAITDKRFRQTAVVYWLRRLGADVSAKGLEELRASYEKGDPKAVAMVDEAARRGKPAMVQMDNLTPVEKNLIRHIIFVYPWVSRSLVWSFRFLVEHPVQTALYAEIGKEAFNQMPWWGKQLNKYLEGAGYIPIGEKNGKPLVTGTGSVTTFNTLGNLSGLIDGSQSLDSLLGPGANVAIRWFEGRDQFGRAYKNRWLGPITDQLSSLPQYRNYFRATQKVPGLKPLDMTNDRALIEQENATLAGAGKQPMFLPDGFWPVFGSLFIGQLAEKVPNLEKISANYYAHTATPAQKLAHEDKLINQMISLQGKFLDEPVPPEVRKQARLANDVEAAAQALSKTTGHPATPAERTQILIDKLHQLGQISNTQRTRLLVTLRSLPTSRIAEFQTGIGRNFGWGKQFADWNNDVKTVASFTTPTLTYDMRRLRQLGLADTDGGFLRSSPEALRKYGLAFLAYERGIQGFHAQLKAAKTPADKAAVNEQLTAFIESHDKPHVQDGVRYPAFPRLDTARLSLKQLDVLQASLAVKPWDKLSTIDKQVLGVKVTPQVTEAYKLLDRWLADARAKLPVGGTLPSDARQQWASYLSKQVPGFGVDYARSQEILARRLSTLKPIVESQNRNLWQELLGAASKQYSALLGANYSKSQAAEQWARTDAPQVWDWVQQQNPVFVAEVKRYGGEKLIGSLLHGG